MHAKIIGIRAIDQHGDPPSPGHTLQPAPQLMLAEITTVRGVGGVSERRRSNWRAIDTPCSRCTAGYEALTPMAANDRSRPRIRRAITASSAESTVDTAGETDKDRGERRDEGLQLRTDAHGK
jgi:hypothetical protein